MNNRTLWLSLCALLSACAGLSNIKESYSRHESFEVRQNYQSVFRSIAQRVQECLPISQTNLYADIRMGEIRSANELGTMMLVEVAAINDEISKIDIYTGIATWNRFIERIEGLAKGQSVQC